MNKFLPRLTL